MRAIATLVGITLSVALSTSASAEGDHNPIGLYSGSGSKFGNYNHSSESVDAKDLYKQDKELIKMRKLRKKIQEKRKAGFAKLETTTDEVERTKLENHLNRLNRQLADLNNQIEQRKSKIAKNSSYASYLSGNSAALSSTLGNGNYNMFESGGSHGEGSRMPGSDSWK